MNQNNKIIRLLSNEPCKEDAFEGQSHKHISEQVAQIIKNESDIHIIGIEGGWGSGKSNLISLVNIELNGNVVYDTSFDQSKAPYPFFVYDAWGHQVDYQRRAILEELTYDLTSQKKILKDKKWRIKLANLLSKKKKTSTKEVPKLGIGIIVGAILCLLTPLIIFFVGLIPENKWGLRLLVATSPYIIGFIVAIWERYKSLKDVNERVTFTNLIAELILIYKDRVKENETYVTISEKEPSSSEFKRWMEELNTDLSKEDKTLIIVFDNMDRLPSFQVESLWSSIHTFFSDKTYDHIKVLIPFDRKHVNQAFKKESSDNISYGNDFINKTFDIVFRVPPPIMSSWQNYMEELWGKAFGVNEKPNIAVKQIYGALKRNDTPREIIAFINEFATIKLTMKDDIPDKYIALFIFGKEQMENNPVGELLNPTFMGDVKFEYQNNPDTIKYLSSLYYHLPVNQAMDIVFVKEAEEALNTGNSNRLISIMEHIDIPSVMGNAILKVTDIERATFALSGLDEHLNYNSYDKMPDWLKKIWEDLYCHCNNSNLQWNEVKDFHSILFQHVYSKELAIKILQGYFTIEDDEWAPEKFKTSVDNLSKGNTIIDEILKDEKKVVSPQLFIKLLPVLGDKYEEYGIDYDVEEVDSYLSSLEMKDAISIEILPASKIQGKFLPKYNKKLKEWLSDTNLKEISDLKNLFSRMKEIGTVPIEFQSNFNDSRIDNAWNLIKDLQDSFKYDVLAMRISRNTNFQNNYVSHFSSILSSTKEEDIKGLAKKIEFYVDYGDLLINFDYYKGFPLIVKVIEHLTIYPENTSRINCKKCIKNFDKITENYGIDAGSLFVRLNNWDYSNIIEIEEIPSLPIILFVESQKNNNRLSRLLLNKTDEYFQTLTQEQWLESMSLGDNTCKLWSLYHPVKYQANYDALKIILKGYADGTNVKPEESLIKEWVDINKKLGYPINELFNDIYNILKHNSLSNKEKLLFFEDYFFGFLQMKNHSDFIRKLIPTEIIDKDIIDLISNHLQELKDCDISEEFKEKIKNLSSTSLKDDENIKKICKVYKISISKIRKEK